MNTYHIISQNKCRYLGIALFILSFHASLGQPPPPNHIHVHDTQQTYGKFKAMVGHLTAMIASNSLLNQSNDKAQEAFRYQLDNNYGKTVYDNAANHGFSGFSPALGLAIKTALSQFFTTGIVIPYYPKNKKNYFESITEIATAPAGAVGYINVDNDNMTSSNRQHFYQTRRAIQEEIKKNQKRAVPLLVPTAIYLMLEEQTSDFTKVLFDTAILEK